jgi:regulator of cell morphogenesis and NO signaling
MTITEETTIADIAAALPSSVRVFQRHRIDFCCGGRKPIGQVCRERDLMFDSVAAEIERAAERPSSDRDWSGEPLGTLIGHIVATFHGPLREELPRLEAMAAKVAKVHGGREPRLIRVAAIVAELSADLQAHMQKEELVLFPAIEMLAAGAGAPLHIDAPIEVMEHEHDHAGALIAALRETTGEYNPAEWACATMRALYHGLEELEGAMHVHVHLENNVLFPRARRLAGARIGA